MLTKIRIFINNEFSHFNRSDLPSMRDIGYMSTIFVLIVIVSASLYVGANHLTLRPYLMNYLLEACKEGVSPKLWNVFGSIGFMLFGIFLVLPFYCISKSASTILSNVNSISIIMFGLILGQVIYDIPALTAQSWIRIWGFGLGFIVFTCALCVVMAMIWLLSYFAKQHCFINKIQQIHPAIRIPASILFFSPLVWFYCKG